MPTKEELENYFNNKHIEIFDSNNEKSKDLPENVHVEYIIEHEKNEDGMYKQKTHIDIYRDNILVKSLIPGLDEYLVFKDEYVFLSSDGIFEVYNTLTDKYYSQELFIVPFHFTVEWGDYRKDYDKTEETPHRMTINAEGCYWGFESLSVFFELVLSKADYGPNYDLMLISFNEWEEDDEEPSSDA